MADQVETTSTAPVVDRRAVPRVVLPRGVQTWLMAALEVGMLGIIFLTGKPEGPAGPRPGTQPAAAPTADRVRDYQDRLRVLDEQASRRPSGRPDARARRQLYFSADALDGSSRAPVRLIVGRQRRDARPVRE